MPTDPILDADAIQRVPVPKHDQTDDRDEAARWIEQEWPASLSAIAERSGYSRQHISNTLRTYFEPADEEAEQVADTPLSNATLEVDVMKLIEVFRLGYRLGREDERQAQADGALDVDGDLTDIMGVVDR